MDAPHHLTERGITVNKLPPDLLMGSDFPAEVHDLVGNGSEAYDVARLHFSQDTTRLLIKSSNSHFREDKLNEFEPSFVHLTHQAAALLIKWSVRLVGVDYLSVEAYGVKNARVHHILLGAGVVIVEGLDLPRTGGALPTGLAPASFRMAMALRHGLLSSGIEPYYCLTAEGTEMIHKQPAKKKGFVRVTFELPSSMWAERVNLVGEFNDWDTTATHMTRSRSDANWRATVELESGQRYRFRYLVDGKEWLNDWQPDDHVENAYGSVDSVVDLTSSGETSA